LVTAALIARGAAPTAFAFASAVAILVLLAVWRLPVEERVQTARQSMRAAIRDGAMFVAHQPVLRAIALCAIFWNFAFFALTAVLAPFALRVAGLDVEAVGRAWAIYGAGLLLGAVVAPPALRRLPTAFLFLFGPFLSLMGVAVLAVSGSVQGQWALPFGLFCVGFGPMLWLVLQTSVRQILTPPDLLGRVGATISTAIYGVRPIGALAAGLVSERWSLEAAVWLAVISFALSVLAIAWSPAARMRSLPTGPVTA
jgi:predicted MFS family arabinose efflux permease